MLLTVISLTAIGGCTDVDVDVASTRALQPDVPPLQAELHLQYSELALREMAEGNPASAKLYNDKALQAAAGHRVLPEKPQGPEMQVHYDRLVAFMGSASRTSAAVLARAQVMYECWHEERRENIDPGDIAACEQAFETALQSHETGMPIKKQHVN